MKRKIVILTEIISPYRVPVFNSLAEVYGKELLVIFLAKTVPGRYWKTEEEKIRFNYEVSPGIAFNYHKTDNFPYIFNPGIFLRLMKFSPDVIIVGGYQHPSYFLALCFAKLFKKKIIAWSESHNYELRKHNLILDSLKKFLIKRFDGFIVPGKAAGEYITSLRGSADKIWKAPNAVDNDAFAAVCSEYKIRKQEMKLKLGYPEKNILFVGRLLESKGIADLIEAFKILSGQYSGLGLILVGSGRGEGIFRSLGGESQNVFFAGFIQQDVLPLYYAVADVFVLPSYNEVWGLALNEAMSCGLPVIASDIAGAAFDLIQPGVNGYIFKAAEIGQLVSRLKEILNDEQKRIDMGQNSLQIIKDYSPARCAEGIIQAISEI